MGRSRKEENSELAPGVYANNPRGNWRVKDQTGKWRYFPKGKYDEAESFANFVSNLKLKPDLVATLIDQYLAELPKRTQNKSGTIYNKTKILERWKKNIGHHSVFDVDTEALQKIFDKMTPAAYQNHRKVWVQFGKWLVAKGFWPANHVEGTLAISAPRQKHRHTDEGYQAIYDAAPEWLQIAMELAVSSLQDRGVLCELTSDSIRSGRIRLTRAKTGAHLAIEYAAGSRLDQAVKAAQASFVAGDTLIRRIPQRRRPGPGWSVVNPTYLSQTFAKVRDKSGAYDEIPKELRPDFRSLRSYGAHLYREAGYSESYVQALMAHSDAKMTAYYAEDGYDPRYVNVRADL